jgi:glycosyltransferase involved in cell wall biosynthesis
VQAALLRKVYGLGRDKCVVASHGVDVLPDREVRMAANGSTTFLVIGALRRNKNILEAVEAFLAVASDRHDIQLTIAGRVPRSDRKYWRRCSDLIRQSDQPIRVVDRYLSEEEFLDLLSAASCVVLPYSSFSSQSGVVLRAASLGIPMIASRDVRIDDASLSEFCSALQLRESTSEEIARAMRAFLALPSAVRVALGVQLREFCRSRLDWDSVIGPRFTEVYERLRSGAARSGHGVE